MVFRTLLIAITVFGFLFSGCGKKPKQAQSQGQNVQIPTVATTPAADTASKKDSMDVFNEFYKDSKGAGAKSKKISKTFSVSTPATPESYTPEFSENGRYVVQIAASSSQAAADELTASIKGKGYPAYVTEVQNPTTTLQGTYYRVRIGAFARLADAKAFGENILRQANYDYWVDLKSNEGMGYGTQNNTGSYPSSGTSITPTYTPPSSEPAATPAPAYTPTEQNLNTTSPSPSPSTSPSPGAPGSTSGTGSNWSTGTSSLPSTETPSTQPAAASPAPSSGTTGGGAGTWGETGWKADSSSK